MACASCGQHWLFILVLYFAHSRTVFAIGKFPIKYSGTHYNWKNKENTYIIASVF